MKAAVFFVDVDVLGLDDESSAFRHSISRIQAKVHEHLVDLDRVRQRDAKIRCRAETDLYVLSNYPSQEAYSFLDQVVEVDPSKVAGLAGARTPGAGKSTPQPAGLVARDCSWSIRTFPYTVPTFQKHFDQAQRAVAG